VATRLVGVRHLERVEDKVEADALKEVILVVEDGHRGVGEAPRTDAALWRHPAVGEGGMGQLEGAVVGGIGVLRIARDMK
jgi:hypothetical protein